MDGKNIADFIDPDIEAKLEALEREEEKLEAEGFYESEEEIVGVPSYAYQPLAYADLLADPSRSIPTKRLSWPKKNPTKQPSSFLSVARCSRMGLLCPAQQRLVSEQRLI